MHHCLGNKTLHPYILWVETSASAMLKCAMAFIFCFLFAFSSSAQCVTAPFISSQSSSQILCASGTTVSVAVTGGDPAPSFQWRKDGADILGATSSSYTASAPGTYQLVISNACTTIISPPDKAVAVVKTIGVERIVVQALEISS